MSTQVPEHCAACNAYGWHVRRCPNGEPYWWCGVCREDHATEACPVVTAALNRQESITGGSGSVMECDR